MLLLTFRTGFAASERACPTVAQETKRVIEVLNGLPNKKFAPVRANTPIWTSFRMGLGSGIGWLHQLGLKDLAEGIPDDYIGQAPPQKDDDLITPLDWGKLIVSECIESRQAR